MRLPRSGFLERRGAALVVFGLFVAGGLVFVFAGTLARANVLEAQAAVARAERDALRERVAAGVLEMQFIETDAFVEHQARAEGFGEPHEVSFRLPANAPSPPRIVPLGAGREATVGGSPMDAWMELLFGP